MVGEKLYTQPNRVRAFLALVFTLNMPMGQVVVVDHRTLVSLPEAVVVVVMVHKVQAEVAVMVPLQVDTAEGCLVIPLCHRCSWVVVVVVE